jgi:CRISPR-associated protein (TIGR02710 family)
MNNKPVSSPLLVATVGGSPDPLTATLAHWRPGRVIFIVSPETRTHVREKIVPTIQAGGWKDFDAGRWECFEIPNAQDYADVFNQLRRLDSRISDGQRDHDGAGVVVDFTGGTKAMSAALALAAGRWNCRISYVGGVERTKDGVGIVISGKEQIVHTQNPWDALGMIAMDQALLLLRQHSFAASVELLQTTRDRLDDPVRKGEFVAVHLLADALSKWDRFQHRDALNVLETIAKQTHNFEALFGYEPTQRLLSNIGCLRNHLEKISAPIKNGAPGISRELVLDLLANAQRRMSECRWDDATARLYRSIEAIAQLCLAKHDVLDTSAVSLDKLPEPLRTEVNGETRDGKVKLGLQHAWQLLALLNDPAGLKFQESDLADPKKSPLAARNQSILAHGFSPITEQVPKRLFKIALEFADACETDLPQSPVKTLI